MPQMTKKAGRSKRVVKNPPKPTRAERATKGPMPRCDGTQTTVAPLAKWIMLDVGCDMAGAYRLIHRFFPGMIEQARKNMAELRNRGWTIAE